MFFLADDEICDLVGSFFRFSYLDPSIKYQRVQPGGYGLIIIRHYLSK